MTDIAKSTPNKIEIVQRDNAYKGFYKLDRVQLRHEKFDGGMSRVINREVFVRHDAVCVLPYDPQRDCVVLIEQFRVGAMQKLANPWLLELVAGLIGPAAPHRARRTRAQSLAARLGATRRGSKASRTTPSGSSSITR